MLVDLLPASVPFFDYVEYGIKSSSEHSLDSLKSGQPLLPTPSWLLVHAIVRVCPLSQGFFQTSSETEVNPRHKANAFASFTICFRANIGKTSK